ncbi:MAG TPA: hypothetical protein VLH79_14905 [Chthonomonadales bacterium]|nr:hypothetical protein [Chthonomonadales bacterium]
MASSEGGAGAAGETEVLRWTVRLRDRAPRRVGVVVVAMVAAAGIGWALMGTPLASAVALLLLFSATAEYLLPVHHILSTRKASVTCGLSRQEIEWSRVVRVARAGDQVLLSPLRSASRLDAFRGVLLRCTAEDGPAGVERVLDAVRRCREGQTADA